MTTLVVLFNLKPDADQQAYEQWARQTDLPTVKALSSIDCFEVLKTQSMLMSDQPPPYQYIELIEVGDMVKFGQEVASANMQRVAREFQAFADNPLFILTEHI